MDESFEDSVKISELFKPSVLKLEEIFMPYPTNFGNEFNEIRHSKNDNLQSSSTNNINLIQPNNLVSENNSSFPNYKSASAQFTDLQNTSDAKIPSQSIQAECNTLSYEKQEQTKQQELKFNEDNGMTIDDFAKVFAPVVSESLDFLSPEDVHSLINEMFLQSQQHLNENHS